MHIKNATTCEAFEVFNVCGGLRSILIPGALISTEGHNKR